MAAALYNDAIEATQDSPVAITGLVTDVKSRVLGGSSSCVSNEYSSPIKPSDMEEADYNATFGKVKTMCTNIIMNFVQSNGPKDVFLPESISSELKNEISKNVYHPKIFSKAQVYIKKLLKQSSFPKFVKYATHQSFTAFNAEIPNYTIKDLVQNLLPSPFSYKDFLEFLKTTRSEENLEFLAAIMEHQKISESIYPFPLKCLTKNGALSITIFQNLDFAQSKANTDDKCELTPAKKPHDMSQQVFADTLVRVRDSMKSLIDTFVRADSDKEVNLPINQRKPLIAGFNSGYYHPDLLMFAFEHISNMLRVNSLSKFLKIGFEHARFNAILEQSIPKVTLNQLINDEAPQPYSQKGKHTLTRFP